MSRFPGDKHVVSCPGVCPRTHVGGAKRGDAASKRSVNRATQALKQAASARRTSHPAPGAYFTRLLGRMDKAKAESATPHKLARLVRALLSKGLESTDLDQQYDEERY